jgi:hypothetical protein
LDIEIVFTSKTIFNLRIMTEIETILPEVL